jgi:hypothetical protein
MSPARHGNGPDEGDVDRTLARPRTLLVTGGSLAVLAGIVLAGTVPVPMVPGGTPDQTPTSTPTPTPESWRTHGFDEPFTVGSEVQIRYEVTGATMRRVQDPARAELKDGEPVEVAVRVRITNLWDRPYTSVQYHVVLVDRDGDEHSHQLRNESTEETETPEPVEPGATGTRTFVYGVSEPRERWHLRFEPLAEPPGEGSHYVPIRFDLGSD